MESFFSTLKTECIQDKIYLARILAERKIKFLLCKLGLLWRFTVLLVLARTVNLFGLFKITVR
jgi:hypothetical protein